MRSFLARDHYPISGKTFLVTGGSRGLGLILARQLCEAGGNVAVCARDTREVELARSDLEGRGGEVLAIVADVSDHAEAAAFVRETYARFGAIHGVVNNAGVIQVGPFEAMREADYELSLRTHFWAPYYVVTEALPYLRARGSEARILNVCSVGGKLAMPHMLPYAVGKFALAGYSEGLRAELASTGVRVTCAFPGLMRTGSPRQALVKGDREREYAWFAIADSLPILSMDAQRAARKMIAAMRRGESEVVIGAPAWVATRVRALFPELTAWVLARVNERLPKGSPFDTESVRGADIPASVKFSRWTRASDEAARQNNELVH